MSLSERLAERQEVRVGWLARAVDQWSEDASVVGAWLWGSEGTGVADALSDYDLFVALADGGDRDRLETVHRRFPRYGQVLWCRESPYNAPTGGRYFTVGYPAPLAPLGIDWYWQTEQDVEVGTDTRILVEKRPLNRVPQPTYALFPNVRTKTAYKHPDEPRQRIEGRVQLFWSMYGAVSKWAARLQDARVAHELPRLSAIVDEAASYVSGSTRALRGDEPVIPALRHLALEMTSLHPLLEGAGIELPSSETAWTWLRLAEELRAAGWEPS